MIFHWLVFITSTVQNLPHFCIKEYSKQLKKWQIVRPTTSSKCRHQQKHKSMRVLLFLKQGHRTCFFSRDVVRTPGKYVYAFTA